MRFRYEGALLADVIAEYGDPSLEIKELGEGCILTNLTS